jgi:hypothetical protein
VIVITRGDTFVTGVDFGNYRGGRPTAWLSGAGSWGQSDLDWSSVFNGVDLGPGDFAQPHGPRRG